MKFFCDTGYMEAYPMTGKTLKFDYALNAYYNQSQGFYL